MEKTGVIKVEINCEGLINAFLCKKKLSTIEDVGGSLVRDRALSEDGSGIKWKTQEGDR